MRYFLVTEDESALTGLRLAGVEGELAAGPAAIEAAVRRAAADETVAVLLITRRAAEQIPETVERLKLAGHRPMMTVIPSPDGEGLGPDAITGLIRQAIGVKL